MRRLSAALIGALFSTSLGCGGGPTGWNLLLVTLDTTRADILGCYGKERAGTANLDRLAEEGYLFLDAMSAAPVTLPSHSTIMTGTYPPWHGVRDNGIFSLPDSSVTLAELLAEAGYDTGAVIGSFPLDHKFGLAQGFDFYDDHVTASTENYRGDRLGLAPAVFFDERPAALVNEAILPWLRERGDRPFFAWIHYWDPHFPHIPPAPFSQIYSNDLYQGELAYTDQALGAVLNELETQGMADRTLIVVVGDHGEGRGEHKEQTHSLLAYNSTLRVPLILKVPAAVGGVRISERVGSVDILPTVLELLGIDVPAVVQGRSLVSRLDDSGSRSADRGRYYAEALTPKLSNGLGELRALFLDRYKYIHGPRPELFDLEADPNELDDLTGQFPERTREMHRLLEERLQQIAGSGAGEATHELHADTRKRLAALGYLRTGGSSVPAVREVLDSSGIPPQDRVALNTQESRLRHELARGDYLAARGTALFLLKIDPNKPFYRAKLTEAYLGLDQVDEAVELAEATEASGLADHEAPYLRTASGLFRSGAKTRALRLAERIAAATESADAYYTVGEMYADLGDLEARLGALQQALAASPTHAAARLSLAIHWVQVGDAVQAEQEFSILLREHPLFARAHFNYAVLLLQQKRWLEAGARLERTVQIQPTYWAAHLAQITAYIAQGRRGDAERVREVLESCPDPAVRRSATRLLEAA